MQITQARQWLTMSLGVLVKVFETGEVIQMIAEWKKFRE